MDNIHFLLLILIDIRKIINKKIRERVDMCIPKVYDAGIGYTSVYHFLPLHEMILMIGKRRDENGQSVRWGMEDHEFALGT